MLGNTTAMQQPLEFGRNSAGLETVTLRKDKDNSIEATLYGAHVTSWRHNGEEQLFLSKNAILDGSKPIRGGIPLVFPQFSNGVLPAHGFARNLNWEVLPQQQREAGASVQVAFRLSSNDQTRAIWPHEFYAEYRCELADTLKTSMMIKNTGNQPFSFQNAFHTYFTVQDHLQTSVEGLIGKTFIDKPSGNTVGQEDRKSIVFTQETDRIYQAAPSLVQILDKAANRIVEIRNTSCRDAVVWNPGEARCAQMADLVKDDYRRFVCVEPGNITQKIELAANESWECSQEFTILKA